ncbi:MAG: metallophosphoesterase [Cryomorphaceae bacterium]|nr:metallophosphoesterase [Cryomorphaceae bacterium]
MKKIFPFAIAIILLGCSSKKVQVSEAQKRMASDTTKTHIFIIGDWGREGKHGQKETAETMALFAEKFNPEFIISTGDNFYPTGVTSTKDSHWKKSFTDVYHQPSLQIDWYSVLGNHDVLGNVQAQIDYKKINPIWNLPAHYFTKSMAVQGDSALFVFIDTNPFEDSYYRSESYSPYVNSQDSSAQKVWIDSVLTNSPHRWKFVVGHHPMYTAGVRTDNPNSVRRHLSGLMEKHKVTAYIAGHEHDIQHLKPGNIHHFVSGAGSALRPIKAPEKAIFAESVNAFLILTFSTNEIIYTFIDVEGIERYKFAVPL